MATVDVYEAIDLIGVWAGGDVVAMFAVFQVYFFVEAVGCMGEGLLVCLFIFWQGRLYIWSQLIGGRVTRERAL